MARKSKPWAVICTTTAGMIRTEHTSENKAWGQVRAARMAGSSRVIWIRVEQWEPEYNQWALYDEVDPKELELLLSDDAPDRAQSIDPKEWGL